MAAPGLRGNLTLLHTPTPQRTFPTGKPLGGEGCCWAWRLKVDQNRHKVKRQRSNKRPKSPPEGNIQNLHHHHLPHGPEMTEPQNSSLALAVTARSQRRRLAASGRPWRVSVWAHVCTHVSEGSALRLLLGVPLLSHRVSPHMLQGTQAERGLQLYVD